MAEKRAKNFAKKRCLEDRGALPEEDGNQLRECRAMHEENFLSSWPREDVEERKAEMERLNEEAKQEKSKSERIEVEREGERVEIKRMCLNRVFSGFFENFSPMTEWRVMVIPWVLLVCVPAVPLSEPDVTFPFSNVNVDCGGCPFRF